MKNTIIRVFKTVTLSAVLLAATGCQTVIDDLFPSDKKGNISLRAGYGYTAPDNSVSSKTRGTTADNSGILDPGSITAADLEIGLVRIDQTAMAHDVETPLNYTGLTMLNCTLDKTPDANFLREIYFPASQFYANETDYVNYLGWYPRGTFSSTGAATTVTNTIDGKTDILYSTVASGNQTDGMGTMIFNHALCQFNIYVYKMNKVDATSGEELEEGITNWGDLTDIELRQAFTSCAYTLPATFAFSGSQPISMATTAGIYFASGEIPTGFASKRLATRFIVAPPREGLLDLFVETTTVNAGKDISVASDFKAGYAYDVVLCFSDHGFINAEISVSEWERYGEVDTEIEADIYFNLSRYASANSYIISSANTGYCFDGNVMGCGSSGAGVVGVTDCSLTPGYIDILYTSDTDLITLKSHQLNNNSIFFFVPGVILSNGKYDKTDLRLQKEGNVIIAAYDEYEGNIIWTWHIWITDRPKEQGYMNGYSMLDRNLGATYAPNSPQKVNDLTTALKDETYGYYYQWGRKDPLIPGQYNATTELATMAVANAHPMTFYGASSSAQNWTSAPNQHLWGYTSAGSEYVKSIYDPCPPGYRVPEKRAWDNLSKSQSTPFGLFYVASVYCWYPSAGYIDAGNATNITERETTGGGIYNACCQPSTATDVYHFEYNATNKKAVVGNSASGLHTLADAYPVRCISTTVQSVVTNLSRVQTANSYIVSESGYYKFKATVRGNGVVACQLTDGTIANVGDGMTANITGISNVDLLWWQGDLNGSNNTANGCPIELVSNTPDAEGYIQFGIESDNFSKGNAIIAAFDSSNNVLWSWHIWLTDTPQNVKTGDYSVMDRNLGATYAPASSSESWTDEKRLSTYGFYYQWGRKDPFPGPASYNAATSINSSAWWYKNPSDGTWTSRSNITTAAASNVSTLSVAARNPMTFYTSSTIWCPYLAESALTALWGYGVADQSGSGTGTFKTVGDPCPPGYQTCYHTTWGTAGMAHSDGNSGTARYYPTTQNLYGHFFTGNKTDGAYSDPSYSNYQTTNPTQVDLLKVDFCWYPFQGYRAASTGYVNDVSTEATSYTALPMGSTGNARSYRIWTEEYFSWSSMSTLYYTASQQVDGAPSPNGRAVRCAKQ